jgi:hypothetical protein
MRQAFEILKEINDNPDCLRARQSLRLNSSLESFERNTQRLLACLQMSPSIKGSFVAPDGKILYVAFAEVSRNLFNYTVTAAAIIDHLKAQDDEVYGERGENDRPNLSGLLRAHKKLLSSQLIFGLRQYFHHFSIPSLFVGNGNIAIDSSSLLEWSGWTKKTLHAAKDFLSTKPGVHIHALVNNYKQDLLQLASEYQREQQRFLQREYQIYNALAQEHDNIVMQELQSIIDQSVASEDCTGQMLEDNLVGRINSDIWRAVHEAKSPGLRGEAMITGLSKLGLKFDEAKIRAIYMHPV